MAIARRKTTKRHTADALVRGAVLRFIREAGLEDTYKAITEESLEWIDDPHDRPDGSMWPRGEMPHSNGTERVVALSRMVESLPDNARSVVRMVLGAEVDVEGETVSKHAIQKTLRKCGWAYTDIWQAFRDIRDGLRQIDADFAL
uniref:Uncharacterized protein n=1 Tax=viral metagenome TaxID=1070528 RepID=A0A6M3KKB5_9ZZZZ